MSNKIQVVGGERSGQYIKWLGSRVKIQGVDHTLHRVTFTDGSQREYYVKHDMTLNEFLQGDDVVHIEALG